MSGCYIQTPVICDACSHAPNIGDNGDWYVGDTDTGVRAPGERMEKTRMLQSWNRDLRLVTQWEL